MQINIHFSNTEKIDFLKELGYQVYDKTVSEWRQWGNHDSQGEWKDRIEVYAIKPKMSAVEYELNKAFELEIAERLRNILLHPIKSQ